MSRKTGGLHRITENALRVPKIPTDPKFGTLVNAHAKRINEERQKKEKNNELIKKRTTAKAKKKDNEEAKQEVTLHNTQSQVLTATPSSSNTIIRGNTTKNASMNPILYHTTESEPQVLTATPSSNTISNSIQKRYPTHHIDLSTTHFINTRNRKMPPKKTIRNSSFYNEIEPYNCDATVKKEGIPFVDVLKKDENTYIVSRPTSLLGKRRYFKGNSVEEAIQNMLNCEKRNKNKYTKEKQNEINKTDNSIKNYESKLELDNLEKLRIKAFQAWTTDIMKYIDIIKRLYTVNTVNINVDLNDDNQISIRLSNGKTDRVIKVNMDSDIYRYISEIIRVISNNYVNDELNNYLNDRLNTYFKYAIQQYNKILTTAAKRTNIAMKKQDYGIGRFKPGSNTRRQYKTAIQNYKTSKNNMTSARRNLSKRLNTTTRQENTYKKEKERLEKKRISTLAAMKKGPKKPSFLKGLFERK